VHHTKVKRIFCSLVLLTILKTQGSLRWWDLRRWGLDLRDQARLSGRTGIVRVMSVGRMSSMSARLAM